MIDRLEELFGRFREAETNLLRELQRKQQEFYYEVKNGKIHFGEGAKTRQKEFLQRLTQFFSDSTALVLLTAPLIWLILLPIALLDGSVTLYQAICSSCSLIVIGLPI